MNGLDAVISGIVDSSAKIVTGVPGHPVTALMESLSGELKHEWSINEKVALEIALGSSVCGERSAVITKHVGMNILSDPLVSSATHTIGAGIVIFSGDDPGVEKSQNEQDSRMYGLIAEVPVFDPKNAENAYLCIKDAFQLSEKVKAPVIIRLTERLLKTSGDISRKIEKCESLKIDRGIWHLTMLGKHQLFHNKSFPAMITHGETSGLNSFEKKGNYGIISSGFPSTLVDSVIPEEFSHLSLTILNPLPRNLVSRFIKEHSRVLVVEETEPVIERQLFPNVLGKLTGHLPFGIIEPENIQYAIENINVNLVKSAVIPQTIKSRGERPICKDCPFLPVYRAIKELEVPVAGDVGCSIMTASPPLSLLDAAFSLGSSIGTACGFNRKGIAVIGDFGFAHSGIPALINAVFNGHDVIIILLQNYVAAMTGGQDVPDLSGLIKFYIKDTIIADSIDNNIMNVLKTKLKTKGVSVLIVRARCPRY